MWPLLRTCMVMVTRIVEYGYSLQKYDEQSTCIFFIRDNVQVSKWLKLHSFMEEKTKSSKKYDLWYFNRKIQTNALI